VAAAAAATLPRPWRCSKCSTKLPDDDEHLFGSAEIFLGRYNTSDSSSGSGSGNTAFNQARQAAGPQWQWQGGTSSTSSSNGGGGGSGSRMSVERHLYLSTRVISDALPDLDVLQLQQVMTTAARVVGPFHWAYHFTRSLYTGWSRLLGAAVFTATALSPACSQHLASADRGMAEQQAALHVNADSVLFVLLGVQTLQVSTLTPYPKPYILGSLAGRQNTAALGCRLGSLSCVSGSTDSICRVL